MTAEPVTTFKPMDHHEKMRLRAAAVQAKRVYPGPVGELLSREILAWEEFGYRFGDALLMRQLLNHLFKTPAQPVVHRVEVEG